jgi:hypothetical protein
MLHPARGRRVASRRRFDAFATGESYKMSSGTNPASGTAPNMLPARKRRRFGLERLLMRLIATCGIVAIGVALGAILASSDVQGWIIGLVVAGVSVILSALLWSSRQV